MSELKVQTEKQFRKSIKIYKKPTLVGDFLSYLEYIIKMRGMDYTMFNKRDSLMRSNTAKIESLIMGFWQGGLTCPNDSMSIRSTLQMMKFNNPDRSFRAVDEYGKVMDMEM